MKQLHVAGTSTANKCVRTAHSQFWFSFFLFEKVAQILATNDRAKLHECMENQNKCNSLSTLNKFTENCLNTWTWKNTS